MARFAAVLMLLAAACAQLPEKPCPVCPPAKPAPERAQYLETSFASLPGWNAAPLEPSLRAFMAGCARTHHRLGGGSGRALLPAGAGIGPARAGDRRAPASFVRRSERPPLSLARPLPRRARRDDARPGVDAGDQGMGRRQPAKAAGS